MTKQSKRTLFTILVALLAVIIYFAGSRMGQQAPPGDSLSVHFIDVGQADCILLQSGGQNMLIDAGNRDDKDIILSYLKEQGVKKLDTVIGTHPHEDHIGSMADCVAAFDIGEIILPKKTANTKVFERLVSAVKEKNLKIKTPKAGETFSFGSAQCTILSPIQESYGETNDYSVVLLVEHGENRFLFTGDAEKLVEEDLLQSGADLRADVIKVPHHGSDTSSSKAFVERVSPAFGVIMVGEQNSYNHPNPEVVKRYEERGVKLYRTDENGTVVCTSDGKELTWKTER